MAWKRSSVRIRYAPPRFFYAVPDRVLFLLMFTGYESPYYSSLYIFKFASGAGGGNGWNVTVRYEYAGGLSDPVTST